MRIKNEEKELLLNVAALLGVLIRTNVLVFQFRVAPSWLLPLLLPFHNYHIRSWLFSAASIKC